MGAKKSASQNPRSEGFPPLLPAPKHLTRRRGEFRFDARTPILLPADGHPLDRRLLVAAETAAHELRERTGIEPAIERPGTPDSMAITCRIDRSAAIAPRAATARDAYRLRVRPNGIEIEAPSIDGLRYGLQTLCQLTTRSGRIPACDILDQPDFRDRGVMLDVSRGKVPTTATLEELVDICARLRLNVLMLYIEHTFDFRQHPEIGRDSNPLDASTLLGLDAYAADRGVELVPCLQSLGHMERVLSIERYAGLAESDRHWSVSPRRPATYDLLGDLYDEFLPLFRSSRFNANCDEPFDLGQGRSAAENAKTPPGRLFTNHVSKLENLASAHGKKLMIWADFALKHPEQIPALPRDVVLLDWWYEADFDADRIRRLRRKGFEVWGCPGTSSWNCLFPRVQNSVDNITRWADAGRRHGATGLLNTDWGDFGHYNALGVSLLAYAWGAQQAWSGGLDPRAFDRAFGTHVFGEGGARIGRLYRKLGAIHDAGFRVANGSPLQYLYFDPLGSSFFLQHARRPALERSRRRVDAVMDEIDRLRLADADDSFLGLARQEIAWAADATRLAVDKSLAAIEYNTWRSEPGSLVARERRGLARRLDDLAVAQTEQLGRLEALWLARSAESDLAKIRKRARRSIAGLRTGARRLLENAPPRPPKQRDISLLGVYNEMRAAMDMPPR